MCHAGRARRPSKNALSLTAARHDAGIFFPGLSNFFNIASASAALATR
jgi:hypothetical protein